MSSVLDTIRRALGRDRGNRPDPRASSEAALPTQAGAAEPVMPPAAGEPALATPGEEAELPIQPTAPPIMTAPPTRTESPVEAGAVRESTEVEHVAEPTGPQSDAAAEPLGQGSVQDLSAPGGLVEETVQPSVVEEPLAAAAAQATVIEATVPALVVEGPVAELGGQEQAVEAEPLTPSPSPESLGSAPAALWARPEESPEQQTAVESPAQDEHR